MGCEIAVPRKKAGEKNDSLGQSSEIELVGAMLTGPEVGVAMLTILKPFWADVSRTSSFSMV